MTLSLQLDETTAANRKDKRYNMNKKQRYGTLEPTPNQSRYQAEEPDLPESVSFEFLEKMDEGHAKYLIRKNQIKGPKLPKIKNAESNKGPLHQSIDPMSFRKNQHNLSDDMQEALVNPHLYQSYDRPVRPDMRPEGN